MSLSKELDRMKYDKRLLDWHVSRGKLSPEDLKKHLDSLPDLATNIDHFDLGSEEGGTMGGVASTTNGSFDS